MTTEKEHRNQKVLNGAIAFISVLLFLFFLVQVWGFYHDDAYIVLRYVKNFLAGKGVVWNAGERVEGYTCFLWLMLISFLGSFQIDLVLASRILGMLFAFATLLLFFTMEKQKAPLGMLLLATNSCFAFWSLGGLETVTFGFFVFLGCSLFYKKLFNRKTLFLTGMIFSLATMTRPDGILFFLITLLFCFFKGRKVNTVNAKDSLSLMMGFLVFALPFFIWRTMYYGHLFPCTFYVKAGLNIFKIIFGGRYVFHFLIIYGFPLSILLFIKERKKFFYKELYLLCMLLCYVFYIFIIGGDHMQGFRFFVPVLPLFYLLVQAAFNRITLGANSIRSTLLVFLIAGINFLISWSVILSPASTREIVKHSYQYKTCFTVPDPAAYTGKFIGHYIKKNWPHDATLAGNIAGSIPYFSEIAFFIDMLGLNDYSIAQRDIALNDGLLSKNIFDVRKLFLPKGRKEIINKVLKNYLPWQLIPGHGKGDGKYVLSRKPDYIILGPVNGTEKKPMFLGDKEILALPTFYEDYQFKQVPIRVTDCFATHYEATQSGTLLFSYFERKKGSNSMK